jgi:uncharacterized protein (DUF2342 family)
LLIRVPTVTGDMNLFKSARVVAGAAGDGAIDWQAVGEAARSATEPGELDLTPDERAAYAADVRAARTQIRSLSGIEFDLPETVTVQDRHHWIEANVGTFKRLLAPLDDVDTRLPGVSRVVNTGSMAATLAFLGNHVLGQYDPLLLADGDGHELYVVHPNVTRTAAELDVDVDRFRRWIAFHEVAHAAEFGAAPWLSAYLEERVEASVQSIQNGSIRGLRSDPHLSELDTAMTAVEGYAELLMDRAFDQEYADLRAKLEARRRGGGPLTRIMRRVFGIGLKRRQYERGSAFFEQIADTRGLTGAAAVWADPEHLPTSEELDDPAAWLARVQ